MFILQNSLGILLIQIKKGLAMSKEYKIHCKSEKNHEITNCGRPKWIVDWYVHYLVFDKLKEKHKCKRCAKKENADL